VRWFVLLFLLIARLPAAELTLAISLRWIGAPLAVSTDVVKNASGQPLRITRFSALISGVTLTEADGSIVSLAGQYGYIDGESGQLTAKFQGVPAGDYTGIAFDVGLPAAVNHSDPGKWPAGHPLNPITNHLHWNWQGGYIFMAVEGHWMANRDGKAAEDRGFSYHIARDDHLMPIRFATAYRVEGDTTVQFAMDLAKVIASQRLAADDGSESTHSASNDNLGEQITFAMRRAFFWLGASATPPVAAGKAMAATSSPVVGHPLTLRSPPGFPLPALPEDNPLTAEGFALGEALFTDRRLSGNGTQSCADCHSARRAFSDNVARSRGANGHAGVRNAMPLFNLAWSPSFAWDGSKPKIRDQAIAAMTNPIEMAGDPARVVAALRADSTVVKQFSAAFGSADVTTDTIGRALEQYLLANISADSRFDRARRGEVMLTEEEKEGFALFVTEYDPVRGRRGADCFHCHGGPLFTDYAFKNNGLDRTSADPARQQVTRRPEDAGKFKTPSLRNVAVTAPYMHDGRFNTLEEVVAHYDHGVERSATLDPNLAKHPDDGLKLSIEEQRALVAFLKTLTDARWAAAQAGETPL
jgi:cytochrome c peroxidase